MPFRPLSDAEVERLTTWPAEVTAADLAAFFTLGTEDLRWVRSHKGTHNRVGLAAQLCALGYLGFIPRHLSSAPPAATARLAAQVGTSPAALDRYDIEVTGRTRREHASWVIGRAGWQACGPGEWKRLGDWLRDRALEHDTPSVLFLLALDHLRAERVVRPGLDRLQRAVGAARAAAQDDLYRKLQPVLTEERRQQLDALVVTDPELGVAPIVWLGEGATSASPKSIKTQLAKLARLRSLGADRLDLSVVPPERVRQLAAVAGRSTPKAIRMMAPERAYPMLLAALAQAHTDILDEIVGLFDQALASTDSRAKARVADRQLAVARADVDRLVLLDEILTVVLDLGLDDRAVGAALRGIEAARLAGAARGADERLPADGGHLDLMEARFAHVRSFAPAVLAALSFAASTTGSDVHEAVTLLQALNAAGRRQVPADAPVGFIPPRWAPYLTAARIAGDEHRYKHYWELCVLFAVLGAVRSGELWVEGSRRYANPASYLIPADVWPARRDEVLQLTGQPPTFAEWLAAYDDEIARHLEDLDQLLGAPDGPVRLDDQGGLHQSPLHAEVLDPVLIAQGQAVAARLPALPLTELVIEVDLLTSFSDHLTHAAGGTPHTPEVDHRRNLYAAILAQACNFGTSRMAELTGIPVDTLDWTTRWYLREETLEAANAAIVNHHHRHPLAGLWGGGTLSSSDGLRLPMQGRSTTARAPSRYFLDEGVTTYTHVSDQHSTFGTQIIVSTERDATYTLDEILGNTTELAIAEHTTGSHGQTLLTFALFDLVGLRLSPRIARLTEKHHWRAHPASRYLRWPKAGPLLAHHAQVDFIDEHWDDLLRIGGSLKLGHVSAALLVARLQAGARQHPLARALTEHGKLLRTAHALRWFTDQAFRRRVGRQLNRGEALNDLRRFISFAHRGHVRHRHHDDQTTQAHCLTLVTNACVLATTTYLQDAVDAHRGAGHEISDEAIVHLSPARFEQINPYGAYTIDIKAVANRSGRRPLRSI